MRELHSIEIDFEKGRITKHDAAWQILCTLTENNRQDLGRLCSELQFAVGEAIKALTEARLSTDAVRPTTKQIELGREWLDEQRESTAADNK